MLEHLSKRFAGKINLCWNYFRSRCRRVRVRIFSGHDAASERDNDVIVGHIVSTASSLHVVKCSIHTNSDQRWWSSCRQSLSMLYQFYHHDCDLLAVIKWIPINPIASVILLVVASIVIWILAPVETEK